MKHGSAQDYFWFSRWSFHCQKKRALFENKYGKCKLNYRRYKDARERFQLLKIVFNHC